jgi:hypothetical protein
MQKPIQEADLLRVVDSFIEFSPRADDGTSVDPFICFCPCAADDTTINGFGVSPRDADGRTSIDDSVASAAVRESVSSTYRPTDEPPAVSMSAVRDSVTSRGSVTSTGEDPAVFRLLTSDSAFVDGSGAAARDHAISTVPDVSSGVIQESVTSPGDAQPVFKVLLADDSRANQMAISRLLRAQGVDVTVVGRCGWNRED